jgi:hypothetical protein
MKSSAASVPSAVNSRSAWKRTISGSSSAGAGGSVISFIWTLSRPTPTSVVTLPETSPPIAAANRAPICLPLRPFGSLVVSEAAQAPATDVPVGPDDTSTPRTSWRSQSMARMRGMEEEVGGQTSVQEGLWRRRQRRINHRSANLLHCTQPI